MKWTAAQRKQASQAATARWAKGREKRNGSPLRPEVSDFHSARPAVPANDDVPPKEALLKGDEAARIAEQLAGELMDTAAALTKVAHQLLNGRP